MKSGDMVGPPQSPKRRPLSGAVDAHVHLVGGPDDFPLWEGRVEDPPAGRDFEGWLEAYRAHLDVMGFERGVLVHSILYGGDNRITLEAASRMGPGFVSVCLVHDGASDAELDALSNAGCRAVRLNYVHGGLLSWDGAKALAPRLADRGMHIEMLLHADRHMEDIATDIPSLPCPVVIDHCGWPLSFDLTAPGLSKLRALLAEGAVYTKLSAPYRMTAPMGEIITALAAANPERCLWGSDWPHLMLGQAAMPQAAALFDAFCEAVPEPARRTILRDTPTKLYRL